ncbi:MAG: 30S ribosomal protein S9 [Candidatus Woesearchaeota archaeon]
MSKQQDILTSGKRKSAKATAHLSKGTGKVTVNKQPIATCTSEMYALRMQEPLLLAGQAVTSKIDVMVTTHGGGVASQADAVRLAIARALVQYQESLEDVFSDYDRTLLVADVRLREPKKPNTQGSARSKRQKSYR